MEFVPNWLLLHRLQIHSWRKLFQRPTSSGVATMYMPEYAHHLGKKEETQ